MKGFNGERVYLARCCVLVTTKEPTKDGEPKVKKMDRFHAEVYLRTYDFSRREISKTLNAAIKKGKTRFDIFDITYVDGEFELVNWIFEEVKRPQEF